MLEGQSKEERQKGFLAPRPPVDERVGVGCLWGKMLHLTIGPVSLSHFSYPKPMEFFYTPSDIFSVHDDALNYAS